MIRQFQEVSQEVKEAVKENIAHLPDGHRYLIHNVLNLNNA